MIDFKQKIEEADRLSGASDITVIEDEPIKKTKKRKISTYLIAIGIIIIIFSGKIIMSSQSTSNWLNNKIFLSKLQYLVPGQNNKLIGENSDRINILLLGMGGEGHDGAYLTDTIMLSSLKPSDGQIALLSIPRDLVSPISNWQKINSINAYAEKENPGSGGAVTTQAISDLLKTPVTYYIRVDFNGFEKIINELGGIEVNVENTFDDYTYPADGQEENPNYYARFERLHFDKGIQTMNGSQALKYARSRHAAGAEGSDFARARRQQLVLMAVKSKMLSGKTLLNPVILTKLISELNKNISTNLGVWEMLRIWELFKNTNTNNINSKVLSDAPDGLLVSGRGDDGAYILTPRAGNFSEVRLLVQNILSLSPSNDSLLPINIPEISDNASVQILNGTWISGLASQTSSLLKQSKFSILNIGNAPLRDYTQTVVYDLSSTTKQTSLKILKQITGANQLFDSPPWLINYQTTSSSPDFLLILGTDANKL